MGGAPLGGLLAGVLTDHGGTRLAFAVAGTFAILVAITGAAVVVGHRPSPTAAWALVTGRTTTSTNNRSGRRGWK
jgi:MFS family permease